MKVKALKDGFAAEISGVDLKRPLADNAFQALHEAIDSYLAKRRPRYCKQTR